MTKMTITQRVVAGCSAVVVALLISAAFIAWQTRDLYTVFQDIARVERLQSSATLYTRSVNEAHRAIVSLIASGDRSFKETFDRAIAAAEDHLGELDATGSDPRVMQTLDEIAATASAWLNEIVRPQLQDVVTIETNGLATVRELSPRNRELWEELDSGFRSLLAQFEALRAEQASTKAATLRNLVLAMAVSGAVVALLISFSLAWLIRGVAAPIRMLTQTTVRLSQHDYTVPIEGTERQDEVGELARSLQVFRDDGRRARELEASQKADAQAKKREAEAVRSAIAGFRKTATAMLDDLQGAGQSLDKTADHLGDVAGKSYTFTRSVHGAAEKTGASVDNVVAAVEELASSIREISSQVQSVSQLTSDTAGRSETAVQKVAGLKSMSAQIHDVIALINGIAGQINLLALNANIEAARAGEAGKGFAVVAQQVKQLADQTAKATDEITSVIDKVTHEVEVVVEAINQIGASITEVNANTSAVAAAVEEQSAALDDITANVSEVSSQSSQVAKNVKGVETKVGETKHAAESVSSLSAALRESSTQMGRAIDTFIRQVANDEKRAA